jgi:hypothetical protein
MNCFTNIFFLNSVSPPPKYKRYDFFLNIFIEKIDFFF